MVSTEFLYNSTMPSNNPVTCGINVFNCSICNNNLTVASGSPLLSCKGLCTPNVSACGIGVDGLEFVDSEVEDDRSDGVVDLSSNK